MRPRRERIHDEAGFVREIDLSASASIEEVRTEAVAAVRAMTSRKLTDLAPALADPDRVVLLLLRYVRLLRHAIGDSHLPPAEAAALSQADWLLARALALRTAGEAIEAQLSTRQGAGAIFDFVESLSSNPLWPE